MFCMHLCSVRIVCTQRHKQCQKHFAFCVCIFPSTCRSQPNSFEHSMDFFVKRKSLVSKSILSKRPMDTVFFRPAKPCFKWIQAHAYAKANGKVREEEKNNKSKQLCVQSFLSLNAAFFIDHIRICSFWFVLLKWIFDVLLCVAMLLISIVSAMYRCFRRFLRLILPLHILFAFYESS